MNNLVLKRFELSWASRVTLVIKNLHSNAEVRDKGLSPGSGRPPGEGNGN